MKLLKAKTSHPKKQIFRISDLNFNHYYEKNNSKLVNGAEDILNGAEMIHPIHVHKCTNEGTYGALGMRYKKGLLKVLKGSQRVTTAKKLGYTHIEGIYV